MKSPKAQKPFTEYSHYTTPRTILDLFLPCERNWNMGEKKICLWRTICVMLINDIMTQPIFICKIMSKFWNSEILFLLTTGFLQILCTHTKFIINYVSMYMSLLILILNIYIRAFFSKITVKPFKKFIIIRIFSKENS